MTKINKGNDDKFIKGMKVKKVKAIVTPGVLVWARETEKANWAFFV